MQERLVHWALGIAVLAMVFAAYSAGDSQRAQQAHNQRITDLTTAHEKRVADIIAAHDKEIEAIRNEVEVLKIRYGRVRSLLETYGLEIE